LVFGIKKGEKGRGLPRGAFSRKMQQEILFKTPYHCRIQSRQSSGSFFLRGSCHTL